MAMKLYFFPIAPNPTKGRLYLAEKRLAGAEIAVEEVVVDLREGEHKSPEHLLRDPLGKLPVLGIEGGRFLTESLPMILFLEELHPEPPLIGRTPRQRANTLNLERTVEQGVFFPMAQIVHATNSALGLPPKPQVAQHFREVLPTHFRLLDERLSDGRAFLMGDEPTVADCTLAAGLQFGRMGKLEIEGDCAHLQRWNAAFRERPSAKEVLVL
jgi:glutathione S-transferase